MKLLWHAFWRTVWTRRSKRYYLAMVQANLMAARHQEHMEKFVEKLEAR